ncbi:hypothetical protein, partial [Salipaludibacillus sp. CF4.18]|uniref:hypothetical protein n=1 Tax=Salipaludibacillus sp. CF4.18 TaxID=3373081 RepID=UPI003EE70615
NTNKLNDNDKQDFLDTKKTNSKLDFAASRGAEIPETYYLLSIIYNEGMHLDPNGKKLIPIGLKLKHKVIRKMICEIYDQYIAN